MPNKLKSLLTFISLIICAILNVIAQPPPPISSNYVKDGKSLPIRRITSELMDSINNVQVNKEEISVYLKARSAFGDTVGRTKEIISIIKNAKTGVLYGFFKDYESGLLKAEELFKRRHMIDKVMVVKHERKMYLMKNGKRIKSYSIALGPNPVGQKEREGDGRTPEGLYTLDWQKHQTVNFHSFHISYPNKDDIERAARNGNIPGSFIMIHGTSGVKKKKDWTNGCIGISNKDMTDFKSIVFQDTAVEIVK